MLETHRLIVRQRATGSADHLFDPDGDPRNPVGVAEEVPGPLARLFRRLGGWPIAALRVEVRELPDDSLVFTLCRVWWPGTAFTVLDALGEPVGCFSGSVIHGPTGATFASIARNAHGFELVKRSPEGFAILGRVIVGSGDVPADPIPAQDTRTVEFAEDLADDPFAKMLVLAAALWANPKLPREIGNRGGDDTGYATTTARSP